MGDNTEAPKSLKSGVILSYVAVAASLLVSFLYTPIMVKRLGQEEYGLYSLAASVIGYLSLLNFGLGNAVIRFATKLRAEKKQDQVESLYGFFLLLFSVLATLVVIIGGVIIWNAEEIFNVSTGAAGYQDLKLMLAVMVIGLAISFPASVYNSIILSHERFFFVKLLSVIQSLITPVIMIPLLLSGHKALTMTLVLQFLHIGCSLANVAYVHLRINVHIRFRIDKLDKKTLRAVFSYTAFLFLGVMVDQLYWNTDRIILGVFLSEVSVAVYAIGSQFHAYYQQFSGSVSEVFFPRITRMISDKKEEKEMLSAVSDLFVRVGRIQALILLLVLGGFVVFGQEFIMFWAGVGYEDAYWIALLILVPATIPLTQSVGFLTIKAMNKHRFRATVYLCIAIVNAITSIPAAIYWGGIGCAACTCLAALAGHGVIMNGYYYKKIGLDIPRFWREFARVLLPAASVCVIGYLVNTFIPQSSFVVLVCKILAYCGTYFAAEYLFAMNAYEKKIIFGFAKKIKTIMKT